MVGCIGGQKEKTMKAILIDCEAKTVTEIDVNGKLDSMYASLGCDMVECVQLAKGVDLWVDEEGLCKGRTKGFMLKTFAQPIMGNGLILGNSRSGETTEAKVTVEQVKTFLTFVEYDNADQVPEPEITFSSW
jgi:hypothetical protein